MISRRQFIARGLAAVVGFSGGRYLAGGMGREVYAAESKAEKELMRKNYEEYNRLESIVDGYCREEVCIYSVYKENEKKRDALRAEIFKHPSFSDYNKEKERLKNDKEEPKKSFRDLYETLKNATALNGLPSSEGDAVSLEKKFLDSYSQIWSERNIQKRVARIEVALSEYKKVEKSFNAIFTKINIEIDDSFNLLRKVFKEVPLGDARLEAVRNISDTFEDELKKKEDKKENKQLLSRLATLSRVKKNVIIMSCGLDYLLERSYDEVIKEKEKELIK